MKKGVKFWPILAILLISILIFAKFITKGIYPIPSDLLVSFYFPWYSGSWDGYSPWTTHKASIGDDSLRQQVPWIKVGYDQIKKGNLPFWNPYNFAGTPHLANIQAFIFYPLNFVFLIFPLLSAWSLLIFMQFFLGMFFFYLFLKKVGLNTYAALLASMSFVFSSFFLFNSEINIINHTIIWMPLILYSIESAKEKFQARYFLIATFAFCAMLLGGHNQTALFGIILIILYAIFIGGRKSIWIAASFIFSIFLTAFQLIPSLELFLSAPLGIHHPIFNNFLMPPQNLITFLAPDFFGSAATNNFWSKLYGDGTPHIGVITIIFAAYSLLNLRDKRAKFFALTTFVSLLFVMPSPLSAFVNFAPIPILSGAPPVRAIVITSFALAFLAAYGLDKFTKSKNPVSIMKLIAVFFALYTILLLYVLISIKTGKDSTTVANFKISLRNLVIPIFTFGSFLVMTLLLLRTKASKIYLIAILVLSLGPFLYSANKILPFSKKAFFFPQHPVIDFLKSDELSRFYGIDTAMFTTNFASYYQIQSPEGYGVLRLKRYAELIAAAKGGKIPEKYERADATFPQLENGYRKRIFDLLGVKYFLDKNDMEEKSWNPEPERFPGDRVELTWQQGKFKIYKRQDALPRYFQTTSFNITNEGETIQKIYDKNFDLKTLLIENSPNIPISSEADFTIPQLIEYSPNVVRFKTDSQHSSLLFLSDVYSSGWNAFVDNTKVPIIRTDYTFRSVAVPEGQHEVIFKYQPVSFKIGLVVSFTSLLILLITSKIQYSKKKF